MHGRSRRNLVETEKEEGPLSRYKKLDENNISFIF